VPRVSERAGSDAPPMSTADLESILAAHALWLTSEGNQGCRANLTGASLAGCELSGRSLRRADLTGVSLRYATLQGADLSDTNLTNADLREADCSDARLDAAILESANVAGALFNRSQLKGARLEGVLGFSQGAATAARWAARGQASVDHLVLWGGAVPPELDSVEAFEPLRATRLTLVCGARDRLFSAEARREQLERLGALGVAFTEIGFDGGHRLDDDTLAALAETPT